MIEQHRRHVRLWKAAIELYYEDLKEAFTNPRGFDEYGVRRDFSGGKTQLAALCAPFGIEVGLAVEAFTARLADEITKRNQPNFCPQCGEKMGEQIHFCKE